MDERNQPLSNLQHERARESKKQRILTYSGWGAAGVLAIGMGFNALSGAFDNDNDINISLQDIGAVCTPNETLETTEYVADLDTSQILETIINGHRTEISLLSRFYSNFDNALPSDERQIYNAAMQRILGDLSSDNATGVNTSALNLYGFIQNTADSISPEQALEDAQALNNLRDNTDDYYTHMAIDAVLTYLAINHENVAVALEDKFLEMARSAYTGVSYATHALSPHDATRGTIVSLLTEEIATGNSPSGISDALRALSSIAWNHPEDVPNYETILTNLAAHPDTFVSNQALEYAHFFNERERIENQSVGTCATPTITINFD